MVGEKSQGEVISLTDIQVAEPKFENEKRQLNPSILGGSAKKRGGIKQSADKIFAQIAQKQEE